MKRNILLNPGPANTTLSVKMSQIVEDICPREIEFGEVMQFVVDGLVSFVEDGCDAKAILFCGSGTLAVESALSSIVGENEKILIVVNGAYGQRMVDIAKAHHLNYVIFESDYFSEISFKCLSDCIRENKPTYLGIVHCETTTGLLNSLYMVSKICKVYNVKIIADCMSSYACYPISLKEVDYIIASSNKNLQGMAGISFVIADESNIECAQHSKSVYLNLKDQYTHFKETMQMRFTPPVQVIYALKQAILELKDEGMIRRYHRYLQNHIKLREGLERLGLEVLPKESHSIIIVSVKIPDSFCFEELHIFCKDRGFTIYPSKILDNLYFRVANIGNIGAMDIENFISILQQFINNKKENLL